MSARLLVAISLLALAAGGCRTSMSVRAAVLDAQAVQGAECIAVLPFENLSESKNAGAVVANEMATALTVSEHYNVIAPEEATELLRLFNAPTSTEDKVSQARQAGEVLGVKAVLTGSVTAFEKRPLSRRLYSDENVVAFSARLVDTASGNVVWSSSTSHFDYPRALALASPREVILRDAIRESTRGLLEARPDSLAMRGLCSDAQAKLEKGQVPPTAVASLSSSGAATVGSGTMASVRPGLSPPPPSDSTIPAPARPSEELPLSDAGAMPALPDLGDAGALPALPDVPGLPAGDGIPALPPIEGDGGLPPLADMPALPGEALPALPDVGGAMPALPGEAGPAALPPGPAPGRLLASLKGPAKTLAKQLYLRKPARLAAALPTKANAKPVLNGKSRRSLDNLAKVLKAAPGLRVRVEVHLDPKKGASDAAAQALSSAQAAAMVDYLRAKHRLGSDRVTGLGQGRARRIGKAGAAANNRVEVVVTAYP